MWVLHEIQATMKNSTDAHPCIYKMDAQRKVKNGEKSLIANYRPISLCSVPCNILEGSFCTLQSIIPDSQHGFQPKHSCITQLTTLFHTCARALDAAQPASVDAIFLDWSKAFDRVDQLQKLHKYGICTNMWMWVNNFLCRRKQRVLFLWCQVRLGICYIWCHVLFSLHQNYQTMSNFRFLSMLMTQYCIELLEVPMILLFCRMTLISSVSGALIIKCN